MRHSKYSDMINRIVIFALIMSLSGCGLTKLMTTKLEKPTFTYTQFEVVETSQTQATVNFTFSAHNPNEVGLKNVFVSYELFVEGQKLMTGNIINLDLPPKSDTMIKVPAVILYADFLPVIGSVAGRMLSGQKTIPLTVNAVFTKKPAVYDETGAEQSFSFETKLNKTVDFPLPVDELKKAINRLKDAIKNSQ